MERIRKIRERFHDLALDGMMIINPWNMIYTSGFTGSNGVILISETEAKLITDYCYLDQAREQAEDFEIVLHKGHTSHKGRIYEEVAVQVKEMKISKLGFEQDHLTYGLYK
ncbi:aminopeptidase P family N-terminal domain-containing protein [Bacillus sp. JJ1503]|uniref:aminopeptidase P family N-terminal domain-containing protein n=1 Tax=unclassified Bacillus (in: firmicutes) TaxID=185979 RepID=UPI003000D600